MLPAGIEGSLQLRFASTERNFISNSLMSYQKCYSNQLELNELLVLDS